MLMGLKPNSFYNIHLKIKLVLSFKIKLTDLIDILNHKKLKCIFNNENINKTHGRNLLFQNSQKIIISLTEIQVLESPKMSIYFLYFNNLFLIFKSDSKVTLTMKYLNTDSSPLTSLSFLVLRKFSLPQGIG